MGYWSDPETEQGKETEQRTVEMMDQCSELRMDQSSDPETE
jgi:hypothetical protein